MANTVVWADIPVTDMERARHVHAEVLRVEIPVMEGTDNTVALLPSGQGDVNADLALSETNRPSGEGTTIYLDCRGDMEGMVERARKAGGEVLMPPSDVGEMIGTIAFILDSEGKRTDLHRPSEMEAPSGDRSAAGG